MASSLETLERGRVQQPPTYDKLAMAGFPDASKLSAKELEEELTGRRHHSTAVVSFRTRMANLFHRPKTPPVYRAHSEIESALNIVDPNPTRPKIPLSTRR